MSDQPGVMCVIMLYPKASFTTCWGVNYTAGNAKKSWIRKGKRMLKSNKKPTWITYTCRKPICCSDCLHIINKGEDYLKHRVKGFRDVVLHSSCYQARRAEEKAQQERDEFYSQHRVYEVGSQDITDGVFGVCGSTMEGEL